MSMPISNNQHGFTLVELLLAMTLFTTVMIIATVGFIGMSRSFTKGLVRKELSEAAQLTTEDITRTIRLGGKATIPNNCDDTGKASCPSGKRAVCFGSVRYTWSDSGGLFRDTESCDAAVLNAKELLSNKYQVRAFSVEEIAGKDGLFKVSGVFATKHQGDNALNIAADPFNITCKGTTQSPDASICSVEKFRFIVSARGN